MPDGPPIRASCALGPSLPRRPFRRGGRRPIGHPSRRPRPPADFGRAAGVVARSLLFFGRRGASSSRRRRRRRGPFGPTAAAAARTPVGIVHPRLDDPMRRHDSDDRRLIRSTDPETGVASGLPEAAMCVQDIDVQCVLQFTLIHAAGCALHRLTSRVIHRLELSV